MYRVITFLTISRYTTNGMDSRYYVEAACNSGDTKPTGEYITGSKCVEVDTGKIFLYDEAAEATDPWIEQFSMKA